ncbi:MAG: hypothetical protein P8165_10055 [Deltaproteobacteria bacterium]
MKAVKISKELLEEFDEIHGKEKLDAEGRVFGITSADKYTITAIISRVLQRIPKKDRVVLKQKRNVVFVVSDSANAEAMFIAPPTEMKMIPVWLVTLPIEVFCYEIHEMIYTIAHELAHVFLKHIPYAGGLSDKEDSVQAIRATEIVADQKVIAWGFEDELRKSACNYIYGDGFSNREA